MQQFTFELITLVIFI